LLASHDYSTTIKEYLTHIDTSSHKMCGISVVVSLKRNPGLPPRDELDAQLRKSLDIISHRGPDAQDVWINPENTVGT